MNVPIRIMGIATMVLWIFLLLFSISAVYSVKDLHLDFREPRTTVTMDRKLLLSLPIIIANKGYYNVGFFNVTTEVKDVEGSTITQASTLVRVIRKSEETTILHNITVSFDDLLQKDTRYLFNDTTLNVVESIGLRIAELIPVQASANISIPWGAPLYNLAAGQPEYVLLNMTHMQITLPVSFENHAPFDISGGIQMQMYNSANILIGDGQITIGVTGHSSYSRQTELRAQTSLITPTGRFEVCFSTSLFTYGPMVIPYGS